MTDAGQEPNRPSRAGSMPPMEESKSLACPEPRDIRIPTITVTVAITVPTIQRMSLVSRFSTSVCTPRSE